MGQPACRLEAMSASSSPRGQPDSKSLGFFSASHSGQRLAAERGEETANPAVAVRSKLSASRTEPVQHQQSHSCPHSGGGPCGCRHPPSAAAAVPDPLGCSHTPPEAPLLLPTPVGAAGAPRGWCRHCHDPQNIWPHTHSICVASLVTDTSIFPGRATLYMSPGCFDNEKQGNSCSFCVYIDIWTSTEFLN